ncbi:3 exoribonuclease family protein [Zalerion maritima]|uniref:Ribosomal RNA-processing protein 42 n=1 Tax=Zalerion maritima TaxID=339359 RepID=A0AAD5RGD9_9PEZI|nr:3 exoribonuclease family protein [Zalerion maritima]
MATNQQQVLISPAELAYLHASLSLSPEPIRPDGRSSTQFRPLVAETDILPGTNGSARICFADGSEAIVGVKVEVEKTKPKAGAMINPEEGKEEKGDTGVEGGGGFDDDKKNYSNDWVELAVDIPGHRDDDPGTAFLGNMILEALLEDGELVKRLRINSRFHWKMYLDVLLISQPLSYPLPLLSLTTHLALLSTRLPCLISEGDEDPMFDDDWAASTNLYPPRGEKSKLSTSRPPITLLVMSVGHSILFDPTYEELAVADAVLAVSVSEEPTKPVPQDTIATPKQAKDRALRLLSIRSIDPPSRITPPGVPNGLNPATNGEVAGLQPKHAEARTAEVPATEGVWKAPRGGVSRSVLSAMVFKALEKGGVADEVLDGLQGVEMASEILE